MKFGGHDGYVIVDRQPRGPTSVGLAKIKRSEGATEWKAWAFPPLCRAVGILEPCPSGLGVLNQVPWEQQIPELQI